MIRYKMTKISILIAIIMLFSVIVANAQIRSIDDIFNLITQIEDIHEHECESCEITEGALAAQPGASVEMGILAVPSLPCGHDPYSATYTYTGNPNTHVVSCSVSGCYYKNMSQSHFTNTPATCEQDAKCRCGFVFTGSRLGHNFAYVAQDSSQHIRYCTRSGCSLPPYYESHSYKPGEWIDPIPVGLYHNVYKICSSCGYKYYIRTTECLYPNYCPYCGH